MTLEQLLKQLTALSNVLPPETVVKAEGCQMCLHEINGVTVYIQGETSQVWIKIEDLH